MKKVITHGTSVYGFVLTTSLAIYGVEESPSVWLTLALLPIFLYFLLKILFIFPAIGKRIIKKRALILQTICGIYTFTFCILAVIANAFSTRSLFQVIFTLVLLPVLAHFYIVLADAWRTFSSQKSHAHLTEKVLVISPEDEVQEKKRRAFVKMAVGAGVGVLVATLLNPKKASAAFFGSVPGPGVVGVKNATGAAINPSEKAPTDGYGVSNLDTGSYPAYYGFVNKDGGWYIMRENPQNTFTYSRGASDYSTNWTGRTGLTYDTFDVIFS